ncbi:MAG: MBL fold metallo-hydrolase [Promethearchaeota archaeon]|nr:MAG: MBL fold metallo-hydrolase [Candidatus Lokiarchaeota archaeon]
MNDIKIPPIELKEVSTHTIVVNYNDYFDLNAGAVILNHFIIVIDTLFYPKQAEEFRKKLERNYKLPVRYLFITHYHADHLFGIASFKDVEIFGSNILIENMKKRKEGNWTKEAFDEWKKEEPELKNMIDEIEIIIPKRGFDDKYVITDDDSQVEFYHSGGHTGCSSYAYFPQEKVLFTGDELAVGFWPFISDPTGDPEKWIQTFEYILTLNIDAIVPGHGAVVGKEYLREELSFRTKLKNVVLNAIKEGKGPKEIEVPEFKYEPAEEWQIPRALEFLHNYYSKKNE